MWRDILVLPQRGLQRRTSPVSGCPATKKPFWTRQATFLPLHWHPNRTYLIPHTWRRSFLAALCLVMCGGVGIPPGGCETLPYLVADYLRRNCATWQGTRLARCGDLRAMFFFQPWLKVAASIHLSPLRATPSSAPATSRFSRPLVQNHDWLLLFRGAHPKITGNRRRYQRTHLPIRRGKASSIPNRNDNHKKKKNRFSGWSGFLLWRPFGKPMIGRAHFRDWPRAHRRPRWPPRGILRWRPWQPSTSPTWDPVVSSTSPVGSPWDPWCGQSLPTGLPTETWAPAGQ